VAKKKPRRKIERRRISIEAIEKLFALVLPMPKRGKRK
jgi:hypothetical protein